MEFHPYAQRFPLLEGDEYEAFKNDLAANGCQIPIKVRMVNGRKEGLDGRNRLRGCAEAGVACPEELVDVPDEKVRAYIRSLNLHQRHLTRDDRVKLAKEMRDDEGKSSRQIAAELGVSHASVQRYLKEPTGTIVPANNTSANESQNGAVPNGTAENDSANGSQNGASPVLCKRCKRVGATPGCAACLEAAKKGGGKKGGKGGKGKGPPAPPPGKSDADETREELKDDEDHPVPDDCYEAFANREKFDSLDKLCRQLQEQMNALSRLAGGEELARCLTPTGAEGKTVNKSDHLNRLKRELRNVRPHAVCPFCKGKGTPGCKGCSGKGWVTVVCWKGCSDAEQGRLAC